MLGAPAYARLAERLARDPTPVEPILEGDESWDVGAAALRRRSTTSCSRAPRPTR